MPLPFALSCSLGNEAIYENSASLRRDYPVQVLRVYSQPSLGERHPQPGHQYITVLMLCFEPEKQRIVCSYSSFNPGFNRSIYDPSAVPQSS